MSALCLFASDLPAWTYWALPVAALGFTGVGLYAGRLLYGARRRGAATEDDVVKDEAYWQDRRAHTRHMVRQVKVLISDAAAKAPPIEGWLLNRSMGGLGLSVSQAVQSGTIVSVRPSNDSGVTPWVQVEVRYCRLERGRWTLGCKFVENLPSNTLVFG